MNEDNYMWARVENLHKNEESTAADLDRILYADSHGYFVWSDVHGHNYWRNEPMLVLGEKEHHAMAAYDPRRTSTSLLGYKLKDRVEDKIRKEVEKRKLGRKLRGEL